MNRRSRAFAPTCEATELLWFTTCCPRPERLWLTSGALTPSFPLDVAVIEVVPLLVICRTTSLPAAWAEEYLCSAPVNSNPPMMATKPSHENTALNFERFDRYLVSPHIQ